MYGYLSGENDSVNLNLPGVIHLGNYFFFFLKKNKVLGGIEV